MKIISGQYRGRKLYSFPKTSALRPMTQRVKKSVFDTLQPHFDKKPKVLDLFAGTGSLSFESLSRGAVFCHAVEKNKKHGQLIQKNSSLLNIKKSFKLSVQDVFHFLKIKTSSFDIIFADPPFARHLSGRIVESLKASEMRNAGSLVVLELSSKEPFPEHSFISVKMKKKFGDKIVYFFHLE